MLKLKLRSIGNSVGVILPTQVLKRLRVEVGDDLFVKDNTEGIELTAYDPHFEDTMDAFKVVRKKYKNALKELAK